MTAPPPANIVSPSNVSVSSSSSSSSSDATTGVKLLDCPVCMESFTPDGDYLPVLMHCAHSICVSCVSKLPMKSSDRMECPLCHVITFVDPDVLKQKAYIKYFKPDDGLIEVLRLYEDRIKKRKPNDVFKCDECQQKDATALCRDQVCEGMAYCDACRIAAHSTRATKSHQLTPLAEVPLSIPIGIDATAAAKKLTDKTPKLCNKHEGERLPFFCKDHQRPICLVCKDYDHADHKASIIPVADAVATVKTHIQTQGAAAAIHETSFLAAIKVLSESLTNVELNAVRARTAIGAQYEKLNGLLQQRRDTLLAEVAQYTQVKLSDLSRQRETLAIALSKVKASCESGRLALSRADLPLLQSKVDVDKQFSEAIGSVKKCPLSPVTDSTVSLWFDPTLETLIKTYGVAGAPPPPLVRCKSVAGCNGIQVEWQNPSTNLKITSVNIQLAPLASLSDAVRGQLVQFYSGDGDLDEKQADEASVLWSTLVGQLESLWKGVVTLDASNSGIKSPYTIGGDVVVSGSYYAVRVCSNNDGNKGAWSLPVAVRARMSGCKIFTTNGTFTPPQGVSKVRVLVVGGGAGGAGAHYGGGGSGRVLVDTVNVAANTQVSVTIGVGGNGGPASSPYTSAAGQPSSFGTIRANGGDAVAAGYPGGAGGSGGGAGDGWNKQGGNGGTGGGNGIVCGSGNAIGGKGDGFPNLSLLQHAAVTAGAGGQGGASTYAGGGGGGGVIINGSNISAVDGKAGANAGKGGQGYGAGGGGGGYVNSAHGDGGTGAPGVVYVEWD